MPRQLNRLFDATERYRAAGLRSQIFEDRVLFLPVKVVQCRDSVAATARRFFQHADDPFRLTIGQWLQQNAIDKTENRGIGADSNRERQDRDRGKSRTLPERPYSVAQILNQFFHRGFRRLVPGKVKHLSTRIRRSSRIVLADTLVPVLCGDGIARTAFAIHPRKRRSSSNSSDAACQRGVKHLPGSAHDFGGVCRSCPDHAARVPASATK